MQNHPIHAAGAASVDPNGGFVDFLINGSGVTLHNAYLNGSDVESTTTWTVYYKYND